MYTISLLVPGTEILFHFTFDVLDIGLFFIKVFFLRSFYCSVWH